jgi:hypothetical protein
MPLQLLHPATMIVAGPTSCGKTVFTTNLVKSDLFDVHFDEIIWCYSESGSVQNKLPNVTYNEGLPTDDMFDGRPKLLVLDDLMHEAGDSVAKIFTKKSHHCNVSVVLINQNLFPRSKHARDMALNSHYLVMFYNPRDPSQPNHVARQSFPQNPKFFMDAYHQATSVPHGYLFADYKQSTPKDRRLSTNIFHEHPTVFIPTHPMT